MTGKSSSGHHFFFWHEFFTRFNVTERLRIINLNGKNIMIAPLDAVDSCSFMIEAKKIESLEIKLDKLSEGMLYIIYEHSLLPAEANTSLTMV